MTFTIAKTLREELVTFSICALQNRAGNDFATKAPCQNDTMWSLVWIVLVVVWGSIVALTVQADVLLSTSTLTDVLGSSTFSPRYTFNNGIVEKGKSCSTKNWTLIRNAMTKAVNEKKTTVGTRQRRTLRIRAKCESCVGKPLCIFQSGIGCVRTYGGRRLDKEVAAHDVDEHVRSLNLQSPAPVTDKDSQCSTSMAQIDAALEALLPKLTTSCQALLQAPRKVECLEFSTNCNIDGFKVLARSSIDDQTITSTKISMAGTTTFCTKDVTAVTNIEAKANFQMGTVILKLFGPKDDGMLQETIDSVAPFFLYNATKMVQTQQQQQLTTPGVYTIQAIALVVGTGKVNHKQTTFTVQECN